MAFSLVAIVYGSIVGTSLGLTGSGGSILAIPLLVYGLGMPISEAIVVSLLMVATIALFGAGRASLKKNVDWRAAIMFSLVGMIVSPLVIHFAHDINETLRLTLFAGLMLCVAFRMALTSKQNSTEPSSSYKIQQHSLLDGLKIIFGGAIAGALAGVFGVGGGFIIVPLLTMIFYMPYRIAVGTSLASIFLISISAVGGAFIKDITIDWSLFFCFVGGGGIGMLIGSAFVNAIPDHFAKRVFAVLITMLAIFMLIDKLYIHQGGF